MEVDIRLSDSDQGKELLRSLKRRVHAALDPFAGGISSVIVSVVDAADSYEGVQKQCQIRVRLIPSGVSIIQESRSDDVRAAVDRAVDRVGKFFSWRVRRAAAEGAGKRSRTPKSTRKSGAASLLSAGGRWTSNINGEDQMRKRIVVTTSDMERLEHLVESNTNAAVPAAIETLEDELNRADIVAPEKVSPNVVTINSRVRLRDLDRDKDFVCSVVFPSEADAVRNRVSVLAPLGTALLGDQVGQVVQFPAPGGPRRVKIAAIEYQPEAAEREKQQAPPTDVAEEYSR